MANRGLTAQCCWYLNSAVHSVSVGHASTKNNVWLLSVLKKGLYSAQNLFASRWGERGKLVLFYFQGWKFNAGNPIHSLFLIKSLISLILDKKYIYIFINIEPIQPCRAGYL